jgi:hypothetical protein
MLKPILIAWLLLVMGDFLSTFCYHIPEHVFGHLHLSTHHSSKQTFRHYAILTVNFWVLLDGLLGALPYLLLAGLFWFLSPTGVIAALLLGQCHVWWRHTGILGWQTPRVVVLLCQMFGITTPEHHWLHHQKTSMGYGDIFCFFDHPGRVWLCWLRHMRFQLRSRVVHNLDRVAIGKEPTEIND